MKHWPIQWFTCVTEGRRRLLPLNAFQFRTHHFIDRSDSRERTNRQRPKNNCNLCREQRLFASV